MVEKSRFEKLTACTNLRVMLVNTGQPSSLHPNFTPFTISEVEKHVGLRVFKGVSPSPCISRKLQPQSIDPVNGNDLVRKCSDK